MAPGGWPSEDSWLAGQPRSAGPPLCVKRRLGSPLTRGGLGFVDGGRPIEVLSLRDLAVAIAAGADLDRSTVGDVRLVRLPYIESGAGLVATLPRVGSTGAAGQGPVSADAVQLCREAGGGRVHSCSKSRCGTSTISIGSCSAADSRLESR